VGQKTHPRGLRLGIIETWDSKWYGEKQYADWLHEDLMIQNLIKEQLFRASIAKVEIQRFPGRSIVNIHTARPGIVIGRRGAEIERLTATLERLTNKEVKITVTEVNRPEINAQLVAEGIAIQLERRVAYRTAIKKAVSNAMRAGAKGVKILCGGRLSGAEMARKEYEIEGRVPLHTLRARIDYGFAESLTTYGKIGVKVWIFMGEVIGEVDEEKVVELPSSRGTAPRRDLPDEVLEDEVVASKIKVDTDEKTDESSPIGRRRRRRRPGRPGSRDSSTGAFRQQRTGAPRQQRTGAPRQQRTGAPRQQRTGAPRQQPRQQRTGAPRQQRTTPSQRQPRERQQGGSGPRTPRESRPRESRDRSQPSPQADRRRVSSEE